MRCRIVLTVTCGAAALAAALPGAALASTDSGGVLSKGPLSHVSAPATTPKPPVVKLVSCTPDEHEAVYHARMATMPDATSMAVRFSLLSHVPGKSETRLRVPGLSKWRKSKVGVGSFSWKQELLNLAAGATYRVAVDFRWFASEGNVLRRTRVRSAPCRQYSDLPNLKPTLIGSAAGATPETRRYRVRVDNEGAVTATGASVRLSVDGAVAQTQPLPSVAAGESRVVTVVGPPCAQWVEAVVDPADAVVELSESDNTHALACADVARR